MSVILLCLCALNVHAQPGPEAVSSGTAAEVRLYHISADSDLAVSKPSLLGSLRDSPKDFLTFLKTSFSKESLPWLAAVGGSTALLIYNDRKIYDNTVRQARSLRLSQQDKTRPFVKAWGIPLFRGPTDTGSALYFIGDGWVTVGLISSFEIAGCLRDDWRAVATAHDLLEGMLLSGVATQFLKRTTGRETPSEAGTPSGVWRFFPNTTEFFAHQSRYDAFPSGHESNAMMTVTILAANYPELKYIRPVGYSLMALLGFQMVNNGVHWASDYPLGIAIGYMVGKTVSAHGKTLVPRSPGKQTHKGSPLQFKLTVLPDGTSVPGLKYDF